MINMRSIIRDLFKDKKNFRMTPIQLLYTVLILTVSTAISMLFNTYLMERNNVTMIYALAVVTVACVTGSYICGVIASLVSVVGVNYFFTAPFWEFNFSLAGYPLTFFMMLLTSIVTCTLVTGYRDRDRAMMNAEKEKLRSNLLRAISHDLRTPLTSISGSSSLLLDSGDKIDPDTGRALLSDIHENSEWLIRMVENLLSVTRMQQEAGSSLQKVPEIAEEITAHAVAQVRLRFPCRDIRLVSLGELAMVPMDGTLIEQVIINLIENAIYHSGSDEPIEVSTDCKENVTVFTVRDHGKGIDEVRIRRLMDGRIEAGDSSDTSRGMGIGLSLCASIIKAHSSSLNARNACDGGAMFSFELKNDAEGIRNSSGVE